MNSHPELAEAKSAKLKQLVQSVSPPLCNMAHHQSEQKEASKALCINLCVTLLDGPSIEITVNVIDKRGWTQVATHCHTPISVLY